MQAVHESGHVLAALATGGEIQNIALHPLEFSRTDVAPNPHPLLVVWAGPLLGGMLPLILWVVAAAMKLHHVFLLRFLAGFCLIANGVYIAAGSLNRIADAGDMLRLGTPIWVLWLFGIATVPLGFMLWHRQARHFGFGRDGAAVHRSSVFTAAVALALLLVLGLVAGS
jgi:hypothetical protein